MPRVSPDVDLSHVLEEYIRGKHNGNKARASEALSITRPVMYRALRGSVTKTTADDIRAKLRMDGIASSAAGASAAPMFAPSTEAFHNIPDIALQVLRFMTQAVQHEQSPDRAKSDA